MEFKIDGLKNILKEYGKIEKCEFTDNKIHVKITEGFDSKMINANSCLREVIEFCEDFPIIDNYIVDNNLFHLILKQKK